MNPTRPLGDLAVFSVGMGAMTITQVLDSDRARGERAVHAALEAGVTLFDTADSYGPVGEYGVNEKALIAALRSYPGALDRVIVATKGGHTRHENATWWIDGTPEHLARAARDSARRLGLDALPLYQLHRPDPRVDYIESLGALLQLYEEGVAQRIGVSNVTADQLRLAARILGGALVSVQNELSPVATVDTAVLRLSRELGLAFLAWGPLGGMRAAKDLGAGADRFARVAAARGVSSQRVAIAWALAAGDHIIPIPGASRPESVQDSVAAVRLDLTADELEILGKPGTHDGLAGCDQ